MMASEAVKNDICRIYREAKYPDRQIPILAQLNGMSKTEIIGILIWKGEELPKRTVNQIDRKMKSLKKKIAAAEKEYKENARNVDYSRYNRLDRLDARIMKYERQYKELEEALGKGRKGKEEGRLWQQDIR